MGALDGMYAVLNFKDTLGLTSDNPMVVGIGDYGGALATGWAASLQPTTYAPELEIKGWVQGGTPSNLTGSLVFIDGTKFASFLPTAVVGISTPSTYGASLAPVIDRVLTAKGRKILDFAAFNCAVANLLNLADQSLFDTSLQTLGRGLLDEPTVSYVMGQNTMGVNQTETPTVPVFVYHATKDGIIPYSNASTMVDSWCNNGADVKFTTFGNGGHATTKVIGLPDVVKSTEAAFAGTIESSCSANTELNSLLNPIALGVELEPILTMLLQVLGELGKGYFNIKQNLSVLQKNVSP
ncbi:hypothetical protein N7478_000016 [Penicillium angulare]|uniref:uncharacterized protein n=1 Tax=Penicillium angulare TaxID=116970 RepID=UPI00253FA80C|nr:uncharacterized protein N7478_000016 [Penicillium angulare]KAJ5290765.1 hypothetical protein N7478_000016 [Penicillium angulare]